MRVGRVKRGRSGRLARGREGRRCGIRGCMVVSVVVVGLELLFDGRCLRLVEQARDRVADQNTRRQAFITRRILCYNIPYGESVTSYFFTYPTAYSITE